jgi:hypothetical protein
MPPRIELVEQDGSTALLEFTIDNRNVRILAEVAYDLDVLTLSRVHVEGSSPNVIGASGLYRLACAVMKELSDAHQIIVLGAIRTSGARPGHRPRPLVFERRHCRSIGLA